MGIAVNQADDIPTPGAGSLMGTMKKISGEEPDWSGDRKTKQGSQGTPLQRGNI